MLLDMHVINNRLGCCDNVRDRYYILGITTTNIPSMLPFNEKNINDSLTIKWSATSWY